MKKEKRPKPVIYWLNIFNKLSLTTLNVYLHMTKVVSVEISLKFLQNTVIIKTFRRQSTLSSLTWMLISPDSTRGFPPFLNTNLLMISRLIIHVYVLLFPTSLLKVNKFLNPDHHSDHDCCKTISSSSPSDLETFGACGACALEMDKSASCVVWDSIRSVMNFGHLTFGRERNLVSHSAP